MKRLKIHPITRQRLQRFRKVRYAYWAFAGLLGVYGLSLFSELLCNDRPLLVHYEGKSYFPILKYHPEDTFTGNGRMTRPDYKQVNKLAAFTENRANFMLFPLIPFGPGETLKPQDIETSKAVTVSFEAQPSTAVLYVRPDLRVEKLRDSLQPTGVKAEDALSDRFAVPSGFRAALQKRFGNREDAGFEQRITLNEKPFTLKLASNSVRSKPRKTVRVYLNEVLPPLEPMVWKDAKWKKVNSSWNALPLAVREGIEAGVRSSEEATVEDLSFELGGTPYRAGFSTEQVIFPFRPCRGHYLGLDSSGRDVLVLLLYGMRIAFSFGILLVLSATALGTLFGAIQGYYAGKVDIVGQRLIEIWQALPFLYILILMGSVFGTSFLLLLILYGIFNWIGISYYMRAEFLKLRKMPFVEAARCMGVRPFQIMMKHMLPNALVPLITFFPFSLVGAIGTLAALDYLGFGLPAGTPSWGELLSQAQEFRYAWWLITYPSLALFVVMLLGVFVGEGVRTAFDPRQYSRIEG